MACEHEGFDARVDVNRLSDVKGGPTTAYSADLKIQCTQCGEQFVFIGPAIGLSPREPRIALAGTEIHLPIKPESAPAGFGLDGPGFNVNVHRGENRTN